MPVIDHESSEQVKRAGDAPYGCKDCIFADGYFLLEREYQADGTYVMRNKFIKHTMSKECRYDRSLSDPRCAQCGHKGKGEAYAAEVIAKGS